MSAAASWYEPDPRDLDPVEAAPTSWQPIDLHDALNGATVPPPSVLERTDGNCLLYDGRTHWFQGESESLKSWAAYVAAVQVLGNGGTVLAVDYEDDERGVVGRLRALGADPTAIIDRFVYIRPEEPLQDRHGRATAGHVDLGKLLEARAFQLAIIDGVTEAMATEGLDLIDNQDIADWMRRLPRRLADTGAAVVCLDHVTKSTEGNRRFAIGGQHKLAGITGAAYRFDMIRPLSRALDKPVEAAVLITVMKDRPGHVRAHATEGRIATLDLTAWPDGGVTAALSPVTGDPPPDLALCQRIAQHLQHYPGSTQRAIDEAIEGKSVSLRSALRWMADDARQWIVVEQKGRSHLHTLTPEGEAALL